MTLDEQRRKTEEQMYQRYQQQEQQKKRQQEMQQQNANRQAYEQQKNQMQQQQMTPAAQGSYAVNNQNQMQQQIADLQRQLANSNSNQWNQNQNQMQQQISDLQRQLADSNNNYKNIQQQMLNNQAVLNAQAALQNMQTAKPQGYSSKYGPQMEAIMQQIQNPKQFKWDFNGDELFKSYADLYTQNGRQASMDAMGQAAALTGGYGNSWAQQVGNQAYDEYLRPLYDKGMELRDRAYDQWVNEQQALNDRYNLLSAADQNEYNRYRDLYGDWIDQRNFDYNKGIDERNFNYQKDINQRDYDRNVLESDRAYDRGVLESDRAFDEQVRQADLDEAYRRDMFDWQKETNQRDYDRSVEESNRNFEESVRQFNESLDWDKLSSDQKYAAQYALSILENGEMPSEEMLQAAGLSAEDAQKLMAQIAASGGTGGGKGTYFVDANGNYYTIGSDNKPVKVDRKDVNENYGVNDNFVQATSAIQNTADMFAELLKDKKKGNK